MSTVKEQEKFDPAKPISHCTYRDRQLKVAHFWKRSKSERGESDGLHGNSAVYPYGAVLTSGGINSFASVFSESGIGYTNNYRDMLQLINAPEPSPMVDWDKPICLEKSKEKEMLEYSGTTVCNDPALSGLIAIKVKFTNKIILRKTDGTGLNGDEDRVINVPGPKSTKTIAILYKEGEEPKFATQYAGGWKIVDAASNESQASNLRGFFRNGWKSLLIPTKLEVHPTPPEFQE